MKSKRGITLIALIITIIVLLILAGVSIAMVLGDNSLITRAIDARNEIIKADAKERLESEVIGSYDETGDINLEHLNRSLRSHLEGVQFEKDGKYIDLTEENQIEKLPVKLKYKTAEVEVNGTVKAVEIPSTSDGKVDINQTIDLGEVIVNGKALEYGWRYYYTYENGQEKNINLLYENYLEPDAIPKADGIEIQGYTVSSTNGVDTLYDYLNNKDNWKAITEGVQNALKAKGFSEESVAGINTFGGPHVDNLELMYNSLYPDQDKKLSCSNTKISTGTLSGRKVFNYNFGTTHSTSIDMKNEKIYQDSMFFIPTFNKCSGYWLIGISNKKENDEYNYECNVNSDGWLTKRIYNTNNTGIRPLVAIPANIFQID